MGKARRRFAVSVLAAGCTIFSLHPNAFSQDRSLQPIRNPQVSDIFVSPELGYVIETHPSANASPMLVCLQESHANYEVQQRLITILEQLIDQYGLKLIMVEGGQGNVGLAYLRSYGPIENRKQVAEKYLKLGIISGEEYLDIASDHPLILWGVERKDLYEQHVKSFLETELLRERLKPVLAQAHAAVDALKPQMTDPAFIDLENAARSFHQQQLSLAEYIDVLAGLGTRAGAAQETYPNVGQFLAVRELEKALDLKQVQAEQQALIGQLSSRVSAGDMDRLVESVRQMKAGTINRLAFYERLERLVGSSKLTVDQSPHLSRYLSYLKHSARINPTLLAEELERFEGDLRQRFSSATPEGQQLHAIIEQLDLIEKLVNLNLSPEEHQRLQRMTLKGLGARWTAFLSAQGVPGQPTSLQFGELESALPVLRHFYDMALERNGTLVENAVKKLKQSKEPIAALITGGFHSPEMTQLFKAQGIGMVIVAPKITHATNERLYAAVLKYKSGQGSFEDVEAAASSAP